MLYFNEAFGADGVVRPHYEGVMNQWASLPKQERRSLHARSKRLFSGDYAQDPLPRVLTYDEFALLSRGVEQRARAIVAFLRDHCGNGTHWKRVMPPGTLAAVIARHGSESALRRLKPDQIAFPYGPDVIRDRAGRWRVLEDSAGIIGGMGDVPHCHRTLYRLVPEFRDVFVPTSGRVNDPLEFFGRLSRYFHAKAEANGGIPLLYLRSYSKEPDRETKRLAETFARFGIESTTASNQLRKVQVVEGHGAGIFLKTAGGRTQRIGALIFHADPEGLDGRAITVDLGRLKNGVYLKTLAQNLVRALAAPSLTAALTRGQAWTNFAPGMQFINDKVFGLFVDRMIRGLLRETPLLTSIPARSAAIRIRRGSWRLDRRVLADLRHDWGSYVVKRVDEDGGSGVWIGQKESGKSLDKLIEKVRSDPEKYIVQEFEHLSVLDGRIVDLRIHAHVDSEQIIVSNSPWGRANWLRGNGKVNIGSQGFTSPVVVLGHPGAGIRSESRDTELTPRP